jgi:photosystem II stability/assembly factor-like uncharacterized protein
MNGRTIAAIVSLCLAAACEEDDDKNDDSSPNDPPSSWLVGDEGEMLRLTAEGDVDGYPLEEDEDFRGITCVGEATAWVVGEAGTVLVSHDAGATWDRVDVGLDTDLVAVAAGEPHDGDAPVYAVGPGGAIVHTHDGETWQRLDGPALDWTSIATDAFGDVALLTATDGSIWQIDDNAVTRVRAGDGRSLAAISVTPNGDHAAAVGADGLVLVSHDEARTWERVDVPTARDLLAVRVETHGDLVVAVGEAGVTVRIEDAGITANEHLDADIALRGLHLRADGGGQAVGDAGTILLTDDSARSWTVVEIGSTGTLHGVDDFHYGHHL